MADTHPKESIALRTPPYAAMYPSLAVAARRCGYALAVHGSMTRDLDLIAVPWVEDARTPEELVESLREACDGWVHAPPVSRAPVVRPHGRLGWVIHLGGPLSTDTHEGYIDLSVVGWRST